jgi:sialate O-acetylesterase
MSAFRSEKPSAARPDISHATPVWGRYVAYGEKLVYSGPLFRQATMEGGRMRVWFLGVGGGVQPGGEQPLPGFEVAGEDRRYHPADAHVEGNSVVVSSASVPNPVKVRYAWATNPNTPPRSAAGPSEAAPRRLEAN